MKEILFGIISTRKIFKTYDPARLRKACTDWLARFWEGSEDGELARRILEAMDKGDGARVREALLETFSGEWDGMTREYIAECNWL